MNFYTADLHLGHANIIRLNERPFSSVEEMDKTIIDNINYLVKSTDDLYILGDFTYKGGDPVEYLKKINGRKHLIVGNHDKRTISNPEARKLFEDIKHYAEIEDNGRRIILFHYPIAEWDGYFRDSYHLFGHVHNNFDNPWHDYMSNLKNCFNVGVDVTNFHPVTLDELLETSHK